MNGDWNVEDEVDVEVEVVVDMIFEDKNFTILAPAAARVAESGGDEGELDPEESVDEDEERTREPFIKQRLVPRVTSFHPKKRAQKASESDWVFRKRREMNRP